MNKPGIDKNTTLALKLNAKMFGEQLSSFIGIDIILVILLFVGSIIYAENTSSKIVDATKDMDSGISIGDYSVTYTKKEPKDSKIANALKEFLPGNTKDGQRKFTTDNEASGFVKKITSSKYHVIIPADNGYYMDIATSVGSFYNYAFTGMMVLIAFQILMLISTTISTRKAVSEALEPLRELRQATQAFSDAASGPSGQYSPEALENLAQALDTINVSKLDTGIPADIMTEELKPLAAAINHMLNRINESYDSQIRFVSDASHELRTPIAVIQGYADLLSRWGTEDEETMEESIHAIRSEAESMKQLVNQLLFLARGDTDSMKLDWKELNLSGIVTEVVKELDMIDKIHDIETNIDPNISIMGDSGLIKQLLRILTDNSIKYTPDGGKISIGLVADELARITIQDEGIGIPEDVLPHIFDRFVRADESRTRNTGGSGLGLSIGKWITDKHGGHLEVLSREDIGTRFTVVLPLYSERFATPVVSTISDDIILEDGNMKEENITT